LIDLTSIQKADSRAKCQPARPVSARQGKEKYLANITAIISVYDKTGLLDLAKGLIKHNVRLLASGGTAKMIRESGFAVE